MIELADVSPWLWIVAPLIVVGGYTVFGLTGFGSTVITVPVLAHFLPISYLVPLMVLLDIVCASLIGSKGREHVSKAELRNIIPFMLVGFVVGVTVLVDVPDKWLRLALGVFAALIGLYSIFNPRLSGEISRMWCVPAGIVGGAVATIFGAGGPLYAAYVGGRLADKSEVRATVSTLISISAFIRAIVYAVSGLLLHMSIFIGAIALSPFAWIGLGIGRRIHVGLSQEQMRRVVGTLLVLTGASLLLRVAFEA
jgi:uncharacterized membrane protein YfcA